MGVTVIGPVSQTPGKASAPIVRVRRFWSEPWIYVPDIEVVSMSARSAGDGLGQCVLRRRFGPKVKYPFDTAYTSRTTSDLSGYWVRVDLVGASGAEFAWVGRVSTETRTVHAASGTPPVASGVQTWTAYEPIQFLRKLRVSESIWDSIVSPSRIGWVPSMNIRDDQNALIGNRSADMLGDSFLYGGSSLWNHHDYAKYILVRFVEDSDFGGPSWFLGGQADILRNLTNSINFDGTETVDQILRRLIPVNMGLDFTIQMIRQDPSPGFEIHVYAITSVAQSFGGITLPHNPNVVSIPVDTFPEAISVRVVETLDHQYSRINVFGSRIVVCCSLEGLPPPPKPEEPPLPPQETDLEGLWTDELQAAYEAGTGTPSDPEEDHDAVRSQDRFRSVFQYFGAPVFWDHKGGTAAPFFDDNARLVTTNPPTIADFQAEVRSTLSWMPLFEGFDYSTDPPTDENTSGPNPELLPPVCYILDEDINEPVLKRRPWYFPADTKRFSVSVLRNEWGLAVNFSPNHTLGLNDFPDDPTAPTRNEPQFDWRRMKMTIAFESDQRIALRFERLQGQSPIAETLNIFVDGAECWYLAPNTIVGVEETNRLQFKRSGKKGRVLRNDVDRLAFVMAGAIARYNVTRARAEIKIKGLWPWPFLIGQIVDVIQQAGQTTFIGGPITAIEWIPGSSDNPDPVTIIRTGFAS